jgi:hypothetical protein
VVWRVLVAASILSQWCSKHTGSASVPHHSHPSSRLGFVLMCRCEWELDPRKVLVGRRLAVGGFAEVFLGKYEVSWGWQGGDRAALGLHS